ncbi:MAG: DEAD/DEAH box helicase family protein, partial [Thermoplasmata archaeon]|nr:DEAD/DEAH box helicase family protein [Thermoplasmata archaeon]
MPKGIDKLIINSPFEEPKLHWAYNRETRLFEKKDGRREAGYVVATEKSKEFDDPGIFVKIPLVNQIRPRVKAWREKGYPGATGITLRLLEHWKAEEERTNRKFFFCQLEAIETLMWLAEAPESEKTGIEIPSDGSEFRRICSKMATGSGKTIVMNMLIAWQVLNKVAYPQDTRFTKYILVVSPGLTVKNRLQVLIPSSIGNYYDEFNVVPAGLMDGLRQAKVKIINWHKLSWENEEQIQKKRSVDKRGILSDEAYTREVLGDLSNVSNLLIINDEAHHAWRDNITSSGKYSRSEKVEYGVEEATVWIGGLDRIHKTRKIHSCYDFTATPYKPAGSKKIGEEEVYTWVVSDFGLTDAIESGLVKTPRVVVRDDGQLSNDYKSKFYHLYNNPEVKVDLSRPAEEQEELPKLVKEAYNILAKDWLDTLEAWKKSPNYKTPPVMISVANRTETAARIKYMFEHKKIMVDELCEINQMLHIDSKVLKEAENTDEESLFAYDDDFDPSRLSQKDRAKYLREQVDTVGKVGKPGEQIQNVISVGMLSEGWDAKTVTQIMGLRAFSSQLLCEQVVGRGLRRTSYETEENGLFKAEYVNIFGIPFSFMPHESNEDGTIPQAETIKSRIEPDIEKITYEIKWPNVLRIDHVYKPTLELDMEKVEVLSFDATNTRTKAEMAPILEGKTDITKMTEIDLNKLGEKYRLQRIIFEAARDVYTQMEKTWPGEKSYLLMQLVKLVETVIKSDKIIIRPKSVYEDELRVRVLLTLNMHKIVQHIWEAIRFENTDTLEPVFDKDNSIRSTGDMRTWYTSRPCEHAKKSHINMCVFDSTWEATESFKLDSNPNVEAWVKNDHLGFEIYYIFEGEVKKYWPDFIIRLKNGTHLILEVKGQDTKMDQTKRRFLDEWVQAVNKHGRFGTWAWAVSFNPADIEELIHDEMKRQNEKVYDVVSLS